MPSTGAVSADHLRRRAAALRALARLLDTLRVLDSYRSAGIDTWVGPSPQRCAETLRGYVTTLSRHADSLGTDARRLDRIADEIDARARLAGPN